MFWVSVRDVNRQIWGIFSLALSPLESYIRYSWFPGFTLLIPQQKYGKVFQEIPPTLTSTTTLVHVVIVITPSLKVIGKRTYLIPHVSIPPGKCALPIRVCLHLFMCPCTQGNSSGLISDFSLCLTGFVLPVIFNLV